MRVAIAGALAGCAPGGGSAVVIGTVPRSPPAAGVATGDAPLPLLPAPGTPTSVPATNAAATGGVGATRSSATVALVGIDAGAQQAVLLDADGSPIDRLALPERFTPVATQLPSVFVAGPAIGGGAFVVVDAAQRVARRFPVPPVDGPVVQVNESTLLYPTATSADHHHSIPIALDLRTGTWTDLLAASATPIHDRAGPWRFYQQTADAVVVSDPLGYHALYVARRDPGHPVALDGAATSAAGDAVVTATEDAASHLPVPHLYRAGVPAPFPGSATDFDPARVRVALGSSTEVLTFDGQARVTAYDLVSGQQREVGHLPEPSGHVVNLGDGLLHARSRSGALDGFAFTAHPFRMVEGMGRRALDTATTGTRCTTATVYDAAGAAVDSELVDVGTSRVITDLGRDPRPMSADGCTVFGGERHRLVVSGEIVDLAPGGWAYDVDPTGRRAVLRSSTGGAVRLVRLPNLDDGTPLPPGDEFRFVRLT